MLFKIKQKDIYIYIKKRYLLCEKIYAILKKQEVDVFECQLGSMQCVEYIMLYAGMLSYCKGELVHGQLTDGINNT